MPERDTYNATGTTGKTGVPLTARNIGKTYGDDEDASPVIGDISFSLKAGEIVSLVGPSGCGKTTMLRMVGGLQAPAVGEVTFAGKRVAGPAQEIGKDEAVRRSYLGY